MRFRQSPPPRTPLLAPALAALLAVVGLLAATPAAWAQGPELEAESWVLVDGRDGEELASHRAGSSRAVASATKLMTAYVALRELDPDRRLRAPDYDANPAESVLGLEEGERMTVEDLVAAMMLASANDAAVTLAEGVSGSVRRFVAEMNEAADGLGLDGTSFANPIGLDQPGNESTARDLVELTLALRELPRFRRIVARPTVRLTSGTAPRTVETRNSLLLSDPRVDGVKTGQTLEAGYVLVASARRADVELISVVLGASSEASRDRESSRLLDYGFSLYEPHRLAGRGEAVASVPVRYESEELGLLTTRRLAVRARADQTVELQLDVPPEVEGPIAEGARLGAAIAVVDGSEAGRVPLRAARTVAEAGPFARGQAPVAPFLIVGGAVVILVALLLTLRRRGGARRSATGGSEVRGGEMRTVRREGERGGPR